MSDRIKILDNNVTLVCQAVKGSKGLSIGFYFSCGSRSEKEGERGLTHFTEHMLFKGTRTRTFRDISVVFDKMGGFCNAYTEAESVCLFCTVPASEKNLSLSLETLCDMASSCVFDENEFEKERAVVINEIMMTKDDSEECALDALVTSVWPETSIGRSISGTVEDVESITREQMMEYYDRNFVHGELLVVIAGGENAVASLSAEKIIGALSLHAVPKKIPEEFHFEKDGVFFPARKMIKSAFSQTQIFLVFPVRTPLTQKEFFTNCVFNVLMGDSMSSRLFETLREKNGICYSVYSFFSYFEDASFWYACVSCDPKNSDKSLEFLEEEIFNFASRPVTDDELENAVEHLCGEEALGSCDTEYIMRSIQRNISFGFEPYESGKNEEYIRSVSKNDIMELAENFSDRKNCGCLCYGKAGKITKRKLKNWSKK